MPYALLKLYERTLTIFENRELFQGLWKYMIPGNDERIMNCINYTRSLISACSEFGGYGQ